MKYPFAAIVAALLLCAGTVAAALLARALLVPAEAAWLSVEAPRKAERGRPLRMVVTLANPEAGTYLHADLHGQEASRADLGFVAAGAGLPVTEGRSEYSFAIRVPEGPRLANVFGIIYLSREGGWRSRILVARSENLPLAPSFAPASAEQGAGKLVRIKAFPHGQGQRLVTPRFDSRPLRLLAALAFAAGALICLLTPPRRSAGLAIACLAACAWELAMPEEALTALLRGVFRLEGWYLLRRGLQVGIVLLVMAAGLVGAAAIVLKSLLARRLRSCIAALALYAYACLAIVRLVSEHDMDAFLSRSVAGVQAGQAARLICALLCLGTLAIGAMKRGSVARGQRGFMHAWKDR